MPRTRTPSTCRRWTATAGYRPRTVERRPARRRQGHHRRSKAGDANSLYVINLFDQIRHFAEPVHELGISPAEKADNHSPDARDNAEDQGCCSHSTLRWLTELNLCGRRAGFKGPARPEPACSSPDRRHHRPRSPGASSGSDARPADPEGRGPVRHRTARAMWWSGG